MVKETNRRNDDWIPLVEAVELVANQIYPQEIPRIAKNKARGLLRTAVKQGAFKHEYNANKICLRKTRFEYWAARKWSKFAQALNLLHVALRAESAPVNRNPKRVIDRSIPVFDPNSIKIPDDKDRLEKLYLRDKRKLMYAEWRLSNCQAELDELLDRDVALRRKKSEAGKKGGRGRTI